MPKPSTLVLRSDVVMYGDRQHLLNGFCGIKSTVSLYCKWQRLNGLRNRFRVGVPNSCTR